MKGSMRSLKLVSFPFFLAFCFVSGVAAQTTQNSDPDPAKPATMTQLPAANSQTAPTSFDQVLDRVVEREHFFVAQMRHSHPLVETYIQNMKSDKEMGAIPTNDHYFLGRLDISQGEDDRLFVGQPGFSKRMIQSVTSLYALHFVPMGFARMVLLDEDFQKRYYKLTFVRREFLGELRCLVIDVQPRDGARRTGFLGRIWVEDQDYNIVRYNGTYSPQPRNSYYLHFDAWRLNMRPGIWLPAYIYSEESDMKYKMSQNLHFKSQTRLWGYDLKNLGRTEEFSSIQVDSPAIKDTSEVAQDATPVEAERMWQRQGGDKKNERLAKKRL